MSKTGAYTLREKTGTSEIDNLHLPGDLAADERVLRLYLPTCDALDAEPE